MYKTWDNKKETVKVSITAVTVVSFAYASRAKNRAHNNYKVIIVTQVNSVSEIITGD